MIFQHRSSFSLFAAALFLLLAAGSFIVGWRLAEPSVSAAPAWQAKVADWVMVNCIEPGALGPRFCVLPIGDVGVEDVWHTAGMAATGSNTVTARQLLVPASRFARIDAVFANTVSAAEVDAPLYRAALMPFIKTTAGAVAIGMAQAMLDEFKDRKSVV